MLYSVNLRIEGENDTIFEGPLKVGPRTITTPTGGTHICDGTNNGFNTSPAGTTISAVDSANGLCNFGYDATYYPQIEEYMIKSIGGSTQTTGKYWAPFNNFQSYFPGCRSQLTEGQDILWAYNSFSTGVFLDIQPRMAELKPGTAVVFRVTNGRTGQPVAGASVNGALTDQYGIVTYFATALGSFRLKATKGDSIRSPVAVVDVTPCC